MTKSSDVAFKTKRKHVCFLGGNLASKRDRGVDGSSGGHEGRFNRDSLRVFSAEGPCEQFWHGQGRPFFDVVHPAFPLPTTASPNFQCALKDGVGEAVVACDMPEPCECPSAAGCRTWFVWVPKGVGRAPHSVVGLVLQGGDAVWKT